MPRATLVICDGAEAGREVPLDRPLTLGRAAAADLVLADHGVSRNHARVEPAAGGFAITDLGSSNGTFVNGEGLTTPRTLRDGDEIELGEVLLQFVARSPRAPTPPPAPRRGQARPPQRAAPGGVDAVDEYNVPALAAVILGPLSIALLLFASGSGFYAALPIAILALVLGTVGRNKVDRGESTRYRSLATRGRQFGLVGTVLAAGVLLAVVVVTQLLNVSAESLVELADEIWQELTPA